MFLVQTMVLLLLIAIISSMMIRLSFSRRLGAVQRQRSRVGNQASLGAQGVLQACVGNSDFGRTTCALTSGQSACLPSSIGGRPVVVQTSGTPPDCVVTIKVGD